jgi:hypothetical protein
MPLSRRYCLAMAASLLLVGACGDDSSSSAADAMADCTEDPRGQTYTPGMTVAADDGIQVALVEALPAPPVRFGNVWDLEVRDAAGAPVSFTSLGVVPFMPDHGHGTPQPPLPVAGVETGTFSMGPFDLWMPGIWELRFSVDREGTISLATMTFCLEE